MARQKPDGLLPRVSVRAGKPEGQGPGWRGRVGRGGSGQGKGAETSLWPGQEPHRVAGRGGRAPFPGGGRREGRDLQEKLGEGCPPQSRLQQERPEAGTRPENPAGRAQGGAEEGAAQGDSQNSPAPRGREWGVQGCSARGLGPLRAALFPLSWARSWGAHSANLWAAQLCREAVPGRAPEGAPLPPRAPLSSVQPLLVTVGTTPQWPRVGVCSLLLFPNSPSQGSPGCRQRAAEAPASHTGEGSGAVGRPLGGSWASQPGLHEGQRQGCRHVPVGSARGLGESQPTE